MRGTGGGEVSKGAKAMWNVRGVSEKHRRCAKAAASYRGITLGEWLEWAIGVGTNLDAKRKKWDRVLG